MKRKPGGPEGLEARRIEMIRVKTEAFKEALRKRNLPNGDEFCCVELQPHQNSFTTSYVYKCTDGYTARDRKMQAVLDRITASNRARSGFKRTFPDQENEGVQPDRTKQKVTATSQPLTAQQQAARLPAADEPAASMQPQAPPLQPRAAQPLSVPPQLSVSAQLLATRPMSAHPSHLSISAQLLATQPQGVRPQPTGLQGWAPVPQTSATRAPSASAPPAQLLAARASAAHMPVMQAQSGQQPLGRTFAAATAAQPPASTTNLLAAASRPLAAAQPLRSWQPAAPATATLQQQQQPAATQQQQQQPAGLRSGSSQLQQQAGDESPSAQEPDTHWPEGSVQELSAALSTMTATQSALAKALADAQRENQDLRREKSELQRANAELMSNMAMLRQLLNSGKQQQAKACLQA